jgi:hypothetical protein
VDWAVGDYAWRDYLGIRAGKVKLPYGLYNEYRDAEMARTTIFLPQAIYPERLRDLLNAYLGAQVYGTIGTGSTSSLEYQLFGGTMDLDGSSVIGEFVEEGAYKGVQNLPLPLAEPQYSVLNIEASMDYMWGAALRWNTPIEGLRLSATTLSSKSEFRSGTQYSGWMGPAPVSFTIQTDTLYEQKHNSVFSAEYVRGGLRVAAECNLNDITTENTLSGLPFPLPPMPADETTGMAYYAQVANRFTDWLELSVYYSESYPDKDDKDGNRYPEGQEFRAWLKDIAVSARFDIMPWWLLKAEAHFYDGAAGLKEFQNSGGFEKDWVLFAVKTTFHF